MEIEELNVTCKDLKRKAGQMERDLLNQNSNEDGRFESIKQEYKKIIANLKKENER